MNEPVIQWYGRYTPIIRLNDGPDSGDYPIDCLISTGFNGDEVYATILFTGYPVMAVACQDSGEHGEPTYVPYEHQLMWTLGMEPWQESILAHFLLWIHAVNEDFIEEYQEVGMEEAFQGVNCDDGHAIVGFVGEVAEKMHERHPDLCPDPRKVGF